MGIFSWLFRSRDKPKNSYHFSGWPFVFGKSAAGAKVNEFTAMQTTAVYACVRILAESIAGHPLYFLLHDSPNPEMTSFIFRETVMIHLLLWGNFRTDYPRRHEACCGAVSLVPQSYER